MAFDRYQSFLDDVRCICRNMIERGYKSCCKPSEGAPKPKIKNAVSPAQCACKASGDGCCRPSPPPEAGLVAAAKAICCSTDKSEGKSQCCSSPQKPSTSPSGQQQSDGCCSGKIQTKNCCSSKTKPANAVNDQGLGKTCAAKQEPKGGCNKKGTVKSCCDQEESNYSINDSQRAGCRDECCKSPVMSVSESCCAIEKQYLGGTSPLVEKDQQTDIEKADGQVVRIGVSGMTCNGCSENLSRNLAANGARNSK